ncbi:DUF2600 family protein [Conexibacter arvalis]|nr:DUF2600 family protein [Conexibacter arvalis]
MLRTLRTLALYEGSIVPQARAEIRRWSTVAETIPDPVLRAHATAAIAADTDNAEAVTAFAAFASRSRRRTTIELLVAHQLLADYVDVLGERVCCDRLADGLRIGSALPAAVARPGDPLDLDPLGDDGGYLAALVSACRDRLWRLPAAATVAGRAQAAAVRWGEGLAHSHTAAHGEALAQVEAWSAEQDGCAGYAWWEIAAGSNSNLAIAALLAAAADPATTARDAARIEAAYWPHVCAMSTLLDSLVDCERDAVSGDFSFVSHYAGADAARAGIVAAASRSLGAVSTLRHSHTHAMIVCGVAAYYAAAAERGSLAAQVAPSVVEALRPAVTPIAAALRAQRRLAGRSSPAARA